MKCGLSWSLNAAASARMAAASARAARVAFTSAAPSHANCPEQGERQAESPEIDDADREQSLPCDEKRPFLPLGNNLDRYPAQPVKVEQGLMPVAMAAAIKRMAHRRPVRPHLHAQPVEGGGLVDARRTWAAMRKDQAENAPIQQEGEDIDEEIAESPDHRCWQGRTATSDIEPPDHARGGGLQRLGMSRYQPSVWIIFGQRTGLAAADHLAAEACAGRGDGNPHRPDHRDGPAMRCTRYWPMATRISSAFSPSASARLAGKDPHAGRNWRFRALDAPGERTVTRLSAGIDFRAVDRPVAARRALRTVQGIWRPRRRNHPGNAPGSAVMLAMMNARKR